MNKSMDMLAVAVRPPVMVAFTEGGTRSQRSCKSKYGGLDRKVKDNST